MGPDVKELRVPPPGEPVFRVHVGDWRAAFTIRGHAMIVVRVFHRAAGNAWLDDADPPP